MKTAEYVQYIGETLPEDAVVTGWLSGVAQWRALKKPNPFLPAMNMGLTSPVALGLALALPHRRVLALDGDGSVMLYTNVLQDLGALRPPNLILVVHDNESTIGFPSSTARGSDIEGMARAAGIRQAQTVWTLEEFKKAFSQALSKREMSYIVCKITEIRSPRPVVAHVRDIGTDHMETAINFVRKIEEMEGKILVPQPEMRAI